MPSAWRSSPRIANSKIDGGRSKEILTEGFQTAFLVGAGFAIIGLIATLLLIRNRDSRAHVEIGGETVAGAE